MTIAFELVDAPLPHLALRGAPGLLAFSTTRGGGLSAGPYRSLNLGEAVGDDPHLVGANLRRLRESFALPAESLHTVRQVHGTALVRVGRHDPPAEVAAREADILISDAPGTTLLMRFADCLPLLVFAPRGRALGLAHCGWRGVAGGVVEKLLSAFAIEFALDPPELSAALGPCICRDCFKVGDDTSALFLRRFTDLPGIGGLVRTGPGGGGTVDLPGIVEALLVSRGVPADRIARAGVCTACRPDLFFSHRRDRGTTGRIAFAARILPEAS